MPKTPPSNRTSHASTQTSITAEALAGLVKAINDNTSAVAFDANLQAAMLRAGEAGAT